MDTIHWILMAIYWMDNSFDGNAKGPLRLNNINIDDMYKDWYHTLGCIKRVGLHNFLCNFKTLKF